jgi:hypothetical protein
LTCNRIVHARRPAPLTYGSLISIRQSPTPYQKCLHHPQITPSDPICHRPSRHPEVSHRPLQLDSPNLGHYQLGCPRGESFLPPVSQVLSSETVPPPSPTGKTTPPTGCQISARLTRLLCQTRVPNQSAKPIISNAAPHHASPGISLCLQACT